MASRLSMIKTYRIDNIAAKMRKLVSWVIIFVFVAVTFTVFRNLTTLNKSKLRIQEAEERLSKAKKENEELLARSKTVQSLEFKESQIRNNLGLVKENEVIIILPDPEVVKKFAPVLDPQIIEITEPIWKKWINIFL